ncbi:DUF4142 domain-containing protein [Sphingobium sp. DEHP117]|uniref:DUF4142 domain-containing protein n=1 Tax=Sphingobium sp. DEHP117 TaxID=2993436 RepID=UPI0027D622CE|nr:DUF4142 domain-containing protein [Sphingobium sp. DEHP117]MDQ4421837.1 DUF4142 domain-containing protein [Sphingobium sp. DEHP117]
MTHRWKTGASLPLLGLALFTLANCNGRENEENNSTVSSAGNAMENMATAAGNAIENTGQAMMTTPTAQEFADQAAKSDAFEIAAAKLAATNATSAQVKDFARMMLAAHTESTTKLKAAASSSSPAVSPSAELTGDQQDDLTELRGMKGAAFDEEYIDGQVDAHEDALALMRKYAADGAEGPLKSAAREMVPIIEQHLTRARELDKTSG